MAQTMVYVLIVLSEVAPEWVLTHVPAEWVERYGKRLEEERLPKEGSERLKLANQVGADGWMLLHALQAAPTPEWMQTLPAVTTLQSIWEQHFEPFEQGGRWRQEPLLPAAQLITSPYEPFREKWQETQYVLDRVQSAFYESPASDLAPQLITHVQTTPARSR